MRKKALRKFRLSSLLLLLIIAGGGRGFADEDNVQDEGRIRWRKLKDGLHYSETGYGSEDLHTRFKLFSVRADLERFRLRVIALEKGKLLTAKEMAVSTKALCAVNGGFFLQNRTPLGLIISGGIEKNPLRKANWGIFFIKDNVPRIIHTRDYKGCAGITQAIQCGPRLVVEGRALSLKKQIAKRSAIGIDREGKVLLFCSGGSYIEANDFAKILSLPPEQKGFGLVHAMNLDGGPSSQMYIGAEELEMNLEGAYGVPNGIGIFGK